MQAVRKYISYMDDDNKTVIKGFFEVIEETDSYVKFKTGSNIIKIPFNRVLKIKQQLKGGKI